MKRDFGVFFFDSSGDCYFRYSNVKICVMIVEKMEI